MLKASYEVLQLPAGHSFLLRVYDELAFTAPYHFHPEYELTLITEGRGKRFAGHHMADFSAGDLVLIGPHLPHCWKLETIPGESNQVWPDITGYQPEPGMRPGPGQYQPDKASPAGAIVIQFAPDFLGSEFFSKAELGLIHTLLQKSACAVQFPQGDGERIKSLAAEKNDFRKLIGLLEILQELALDSNAVLLDTGQMTADLSPVDQARIHPIFAYLVENFRGEISLESASAAIGMTPNAFCRYFKKITRKTFMEMVIEYRLNYATQQLIQTTKPISAICFDSGFGDISHFYKMFRSRMQLSPLNYRRKFVQETTKK